MSGLFRGGALWVLDRLGSIAVGLGSAMVAFVQRLAGAVQRSVEGKLSECVSVLDFGADPTGVASSSAAINAAIAAMPGAGGDLLFPEGEYLIDATITQNKAVTLRGVGSSAVNGTAGGVTLKKAAALAGPAISMTAMAAAVKNLTLQGIAGNAGDGIVMLAGRQVLEDVAVFAMGGDGVRIGSDAGVNANLWNIRNLRSKANGRHGLMVSDKVGTSLGLADANGGTLTHADLQLNAGAGLRVENGQLNTFIGVCAQQNTGRGIDAGSGCRYNTFVGGDSESNTADEVHFDAGTIGNRILGLTISGTAGDDSGQNQWFGLWGSPLGQGVRVGNTDSTDPLTADWYQEGTFVPAVTFATPGDLAISAYATRDGRYQRWGNSVRAQVSISISAGNLTYTTAAGGLRVSGLPFAMFAGTGLAVGALQYAGITAAATPSIVARVDPTNSYAAFFGSGSGAANIAISTTHVPSAAALVLIFVIEYQCAA